MLIILMMIISGQVGAVELREQSGWKLSKESSDRTTSPRVTLGRQFARPGEAAENILMPLNTLAKHFHYISYYSNMTFDGHSPN